MGAEELGRYIRGLRQMKRLTLREVESRTQISNAYLSQLEGGKIKNPSPTILYKLSKVYSVSYSTVMQKAGYPVPGRDTTRHQSTLAARIGPTTRQEEDALVEYLEFLRSKRSAGSR